mgnify:CR=1 FL=1
MPMKSMTVAEFKSKFSNVLNGIRRGEEYLITYGRSKKSLAVLSPFFKTPQSKKRHLGLYDGKVKFEFSSDFKFKSDEEFLKS